MSTIKSSRSLELPLPPSCVAFSPEHSDLVVVGTYYLEKSSENVSDEVEGNPQEPKNQSRSGSLVLFQLNGDNIKELQTLSTASAILDIGFSPHQLDLFCTATSTGSLLVHTLSSSPPYLTQTHELQLFDPSILILDLEFHPSDASVIGITISSGEVYLIQLPNLESPDPQARKQLIQRHDLEPWTLAFTPSGDGIYSGGDDSALRFSSLPVPLEFPSESLSEPENSEPDEDVTSPSPTLRWTDNRAHTAGLTAILPLTFPSSRSSQAIISVQQNPTSKSEPPASTTNGPQSSIILTGSYDDHIRILRITHALPGRNRVTVLSELNLGGGVWRLKLLRQERVDLPRASSDDDKGWKWRLVVLASCMHAGARVVEILSPVDDENNAWNGMREGGDVWTIDVLARFEEHQSMNYGSDVQPLPLSTDEETNGRTRTVVSTSFYDRLLCLWRWEDERSDI